MAGKPIELDIEMLAPEQAVPDAYAGRWWVAHTKSRNEKALARDLSRYGIVNYLPLRRKITRSSRTGRRSVSTVPVFTGYLFFTGTEQQRYQVLATNRVAKTLFVPNQPQLVTQLRHIHQVLSSNMEFEHLIGVRVGRWVRVVAGALVGVEGCVVQKLGKTRLAVSVDFLGQSVLVEVDAELLEPIDGPSAPQSGRVSPALRR
jgi:transcription antitermination factor NusG